MIIIIFQAAVAHFWKRIICRILLHLFKKRSEKVKIIMVIMKDIGNDYQQWTKALELLRQESALLKYRLSEMVDSDEENLFLQKAEYFQNELLLKDEWLKKLIKEVQYYKDSVENKMDLPKKIKALHDNLKKDIARFEKQFLILSKEFNEQMLQHS